MKTPKELYEKQLRQLHGYLLDGRGDETCADDLREEMLDVWNTFTSEEQDEARALSIRLKEEERMPDDFQEFYNSTEWRPWYGAPLYFTHMLLAVAVGDAEVKEEPERSVDMGGARMGGPSDLYFRWRRPPEKRKRVYPELIENDPGEFRNLPVDTTLGPGAEPEPVSQQKRMRAVFRWLRGNDWNCYNSPQYDGPLSGPEDEVILEVYDADPPNIFRGDDFYYVVEAAMKAQKERVAARDETTED